MNANCNNPAPRVMSVQNLAKTQQNKLNVPAKAHSGALLLNTCVMPVKAHSASPLLKHLSTPAKAHSSSPLPSQTPIGNGKWTIKTAHLATAPKLAHPQRTCSSSAENFPLPRKSRSLPVACLQRCAHVLLRIPPDCVYTISSSFQGDCS